jgi:hypothetical protein
MEFDPKIKNINHTPQHPHISSTLQALQKKLATPTAVPPESEDSKTMTESKTPPESVVVPMDAPKPSADQKDVIEVPDDSQPGDASSYPYRTWPPPDRQETANPPESPGASHRRVATPEPEVGRCGVPWVTSADDQSIE